MIQQILAVWSLVPLPFLNPVWIWVLSVHVLLKPSLEKFEHYFVSMWEECNYAVVWTFFGIAFFWDWNENTFSSPMATAEFSKFAGILSACLICCFSHIQFFVTPWTIVHHVSLSMGFSGQEYWRGFSFLSPEDLPDLRSEPTSYYVSLLQVGLL